VLFAAFLLLGSSGCAMVTVKQVKSSDSLVNKRADVLNTGKLSPAARETLSAAGLDESQCEKDFLVCRSTLLMTDDLNVEQRLSALSELWVKAALALTPKKTAAGDPPMSDAALDAWLEAARYAYAYLFYSGRSPSDRAFEDRQTQVRDYYNYAAEKAAVVLFVRACSGTGRRGLYEADLGRQLVAGLQLPAAEPEEHSGAAGAGRHGQLRRPAQHLSPRWLRCRAGDGDGPAEAGRAGDRGRWPEGGNAADDDDERRGRRHRHDDSVPSSARCPRSTSPRCCASKAAAWKT
jgi:hypothetical protein